MEETEVWKESADRGKREGDGNKDRDGKPLSQSRFTQLIHFIFNLISLIYFNDIYNEV